MLIVKPVGVEMTRSRLEGIWNDNPHGAGFMFVREGKVVVVNGLMTFEQFMAAYLVNNPLETKMVIHFRWRTHGKNDSTMTHPFWIMKGQLAMAHNGIIQELADSKSDESDTAKFARMLAKGYENPLNAIKHTFHKALIEKFIGYSKLVFLDNENNHYIFNERLGNYAEGVWYSNNSWKQKFEISVSSIPSSSSLKYGMTQWKEEEDTEAVKEEYEMMLAKAARLRIAEAARIQRQHEENEKNLDSSVRNALESERTSKKKNQVSNNESWQRAVKKMRNGQQQPLTGISNFAHRDSSSSSKYSKFG